MTHATVSAGTAGHGARDDQPAARFNRPWLRDQLIRNSMVIVLLLVIAYFSYRSARFATPDNCMTILVAAAPFALVALGQTFVILTGGIDLSVGSVIAVSAMTAASTVRATRSCSGCRSARQDRADCRRRDQRFLVVSKLGVPPFVATLGMLTAGLRPRLCHRRRRTHQRPAGECGKIANTEILGAADPGAHHDRRLRHSYLVHARTSFGLRVYAVGGNRTAAEVAGVKSGQILFSVYVLSGALAGLSGVMLSSRVISGPPNLGQGYELAAIAAVVIGGASLLGGRGIIWGTLLGLLLIQTLNNGLDILVVPAYWQKVINGVLIVAAVAVDVWATRRRSSLTRSVARTSSPANITERKELIMFSQSPCASVAVALAAQRCWPPPPAVPVTPTRTPATGAARQQRPPRIGVTVYDMSSFITAGKEGMEAYAKDNNIELLWNSANLDVATQANQVDQLINQRRRRDHHRAGAGGLAWHRRWLRPRPRTSR